MYPSPGVYNTDYHGAEPTQPGYSNPPPSFPNGQATANYSHGTANLTNGTPNYTNGTANLTNGTANYSNGTANLTNVMPNYTNGTANLTNGTANYSNGTANYTNVMPNYTNGTANLTNGTPNYSNGTVNYNNGTANYSKGTASYTPPPNCVPIVNTQPNIRIIPQPAYKDYLGLSIMNLLLCCLPLGLLALIYSCKTQDSLRRGDMISASSDSRTAFTLNMVALGLGIVLNISWISVVIYYVVTFREISDSNGGDSEFSFNG